MFFDVDNGLKFISVYNLTDIKKGTWLNHKRPFCGLSFRRSSSAILSYGNTYVEAPPHSITFIPDGLDYIRETDGDNLIAIHFLPFGEYNRDKIEIIMPQNVDWYIKIFDKIDNTYREKNIGYKHKCAEYLHRILYKLETENTTETELSPIEYASQIIERRMWDSNFSISELIDNTIISGTAFREKFKKYYGMSPVKYLTEKRIEYAAELLEMQYLSIKEIAHNCGFQNEKYFSTVFKEKMGVVPSEYIKKNPIRFQI